MPPSTSSSFFKIIFNITLQDGKLKIPNKFAYEHGNELSGSVTLTVPVGGCWDVAVKRESDNTIWLHEGLFKFIEDNSIGLGYFLMFKYQGDSKFVVHICDLTATEIEYNASYGSARCDVLKQIQESEIEDDGDDSHTSESGDEDFDGISSEFSDSSSDLLLQKTSANPSEFTSKDKHNKGVGDKNNQRNRCYLTRSKRQITGVGIHPKGSRGTTSSAATEDKGQNNKRGKHPMKYRETTRCDGKDIHPREYCADERNFQETSNEDSDDISTEGTSSSSDLLNRMPGDSSEFASKHKHHKGARYNKKVEKCNVTRSKRKIADVGTHPKERGSNASEANEVSKKTSKRRNCTTYRDTRRYDGGDIYPREYCADASIFQESFQTIMNSSNLKHGNLLVPVKFARMHMHPLTGLVKLLNANNDEWVVSCIRQKSSYVLTSGWQQFVNDNMLVVGDICLFERIKSSEIKLKVEIFRKADGTNSRTYTNTSESAEGRTCQDASISTRPFFTITVKFYNLERRLLRVPSRFAVLYLPHSTTDIKLIDAEGIEWPVRFICGKRYHFSTGWRSFLLQKNLQVGDVCVFEHIESRGQVKLKVNIYTTEEAAAQPNNECYQ